MKDSVLLVSIGNSLAALPMEFVMKTITVQDPVPLPIEYPMVSYVIYEEGLTMPLVDPSVFFGLMPRTDPERMEAVIIDNGGEDALFALLVDRIKGISDVSVRSRSDGNPLFAGETEVGSRTVPVLSPMKLERLVTAQIEYQGGLS